MVEMTGPSLAPDEAPTPAAKRDEFGQHDPRLLLAALAVPVCMTDADGTVAWFNDAAVEMWGRTPPKDAKWCGALKLLTPNGDPLGRHESPTALALRGKKAMAAVEAALIRPDGRVVPYLAYPAPILSDSGEVAGAISILIDISQHKSAEEQVHRLAAIVESSDDAIVSKDISGYIKSWNAGAERLFGYSSEEAIGQHISMLIPEDRLAEEDHILGRIRAGQRVDHFDTVRRRKDGSLVPVSLTVSPIRTASGRVIGASKIARDITERSERESRIRLLMREVNHRVKNQFAVILSMIRETRKNSVDTLAFESQIRERIMGLSRAHDLLVEGEWRGATLHELVASQVMPFARKDKISFAGERIVLSAAAVQSLGMAFHELSTNSAKYGALSTARGRVAVEWQVAGTEFTLRWTERGGPNAGASAGSGFGRTVLERVTPISVGGTAALVLDADGVCWTLTAPVASIQA